MVEGKIEGNSSNLAFKMILSQIRRDRLMKLCMSYKSGDPAQVLPDVITKPYSKIVKNIKPDAVFDWRNEATNRSGGSYNNNKADDLSSRSNYR